MLIEIDMGNFNELRKKKRNGDPYNELRLRTIIIMEYTNGEIHLLLHETWKI